MPLNENVDYVPVLIDGPPEIVLLTSDLHEYLVQVPHVAQLPLSTFEFLCVLGPELPAPLSDGLVGDDDTPLRQEFLLFAEAQGESMVLPNAMADDFTREPVAAEVIRIGFIREV
jgi:hypothetical protein